MLEAFASFNLENSMDEFNTDIFTFRQDSSSIVDDVVVKHGFSDDSLLDALTDEDLRLIFPVVLGYQYLAFN